MLHRDGVDSAESVEVLVDQRQIKVLDSKNNSLKMDCLDFVKLHDEEGELRDSYQTVLSRSNLDH